MAKEFFFSWNSASAHTHRHAHKMCVVRRGARCRWRRQRQRNVKEEKYKYLSVVGGAVIDQKKSYTHILLAGTVCRALHATRRISNTFRCSRILIVRRAAARVRHRGRFIIRSNWKDSLKNIEQMRLQQQRGGRHIVIWSSKQNGEQNNNFFSSLSPLSLSLPRSWLLHILRLIDIDTDSMGFYALLSTVHDGVCGVDGIFCVARCLNDVLLIGAHFHDK